MTEFKRVDTLEYATADLVANIKAKYIGWNGVSQMDGTPSRLVSLYNELCWPLDKITEELEKQVKVFENTFNEMLVSGPSRVTILCPHHFLPCELSVTIGYIPSENKVLGLSKFTRIAEIIGKKPMLQEEYCRELVDFLMEKLQPKGAAVYIVGRHGCMTFRGVKQEVPVVTSMLRGAFLHESSTRSEFLALARTNGFGG